MLFCWYYYTYIGDDDILMVLYWCYNMYYPGAIVHRYVLYWYCYADAIIRTLLEY